MDSINKPLSHKEIQAKLLNKFPQLSDSDFDHKDANEENMLRIIGYKLKKTKEEMDEIITDIKETIPEPVKADLCIGKNYIAETGSEAVQIIPSTIQSFF